MSASPVGFPPLGNDAIRPPPLGCRLHECAGVVIIYPPAVSGIIPYARVVGAIGWRAFKALLININNKSAFAWTVIQGLPGKRVIRVTYAEKPAEAHNRVFDLTALFVDHQIIDIAELFAGSVVNIRASHLTGGNK